MLTLQWSCLCLASTLKSFVPCIVVVGAPKNSNGDENHKEEHVPKWILDPQRSPIIFAFNHHPYNHDHRSLKNSEKYQARDMAETERQREDRSGLWRCVRESVCVCVRVSACVCMYVKIGRGNSWHVISIYIYIYILIVYLIALHTQQNEMQSCLRPLTYLVYKSRVLHGSEGTCLISPYFD